MRRLLWGAIAVAVLGSGTALAQDENFRRYNLQAKGGVSSYLGGLNEVTAAGPSWGVGLAVQPYRVLGFELAYEGSSNRIEDARLFGSPALMRNGASAIVRVAPPFMDRIRPYAGVGLGASYVSVQGETQGAYRSDFMEEVPLTVGVEFNRGALGAGIHATYRWLLDAGFAAQALPQSSGGGLFDAGFSLGARF